MVASTEVSSCSRRLFRAQSWLPDWCSRPSHPPTHLASFWNARLRLRHSYGCISVTVLATQKCKLIARRNQTNWKAERNKGRGWARFPNQILLTILTERRYEVSKIKVFQCRHWRIWNCNRLTDTKKCLKTSGCSPICVELGGRGCQLSFSCMQRFSFCWNLPIHLRMWFGNPSHYLCLYYRPCPQSELYAGWNPCHS